MGIIFERQINGPSTHAVVIGVGAYSHLLGGDGDLFPGHESMGQLTSPPQSAYDFATWLINKYRNPAKPLASLELLVSDAQSTGFTLPDGQVKPVDQANMNNVKKAVLDWIDRGNTNVEHFMIFYFCGHGIASGLLTSLLLEDFGERHDSPLMQAIDFQEFYLGMDKCKARQQCYFIDACRAASPTLIESSGFKGDPIIYGSVRHSDLGSRRAPIYYSTVAGSRAYGRTGAPSLFTEALLKALDGAGSDDVDGDWRVDTDTLNRGIDYILTRMIGEDLQIDQVSPVCELTRFTFHHLDGRPIVPVTIGCEPHTANEKANLSYSNPAGQKMIRPAVKPAPWDVYLEEGNYQFYADFPGGEFHNNNEGRYIRPPFRPVQIPV